MIGVVQRVSSARVVVAGETVGEIAQGLAVLLAVHRSDTAADVTWMAQKLLGLRIFPAEDRHFDVNVRAVGGRILLVSNFTVAAQTRKGRRPSFDAAAGPPMAETLFNDLAAALTAGGVTVATGRFGADMTVTIVNEGPATFIVDSTAASAGEAPA